jgi:hypothetical protein
MPAGWYQDERFRHRLRYWDGRQWTSWVADGHEAFLERKTIRITWLRVIVVLAVAATLVLGYVVTNNIWHYDHACDKGHHSWLMDAFGACSGGGG